MFVFFLFHSAKSKGRRKGSCTKARKKLLRQKAREDYSTDIH